MPTSLGGTDRPESLVGGVVFDAMVFLTFPEEMAVCTSETLLSTATEEELVAAGIESIEESAVEAALECGADEGSHGESPQHRAAFRAEQRRIGLSRLPGAPAKEST